MLSLRAPVTIDLQLSDGGEGLKAVQWKAIVERIAPLLNEVRVAGLECLDVSEREVVLNALEAGKRFYHLVFRAVPAQSMELLEDLRSREFFGSLLVEYRGENEPSDNGGSDTILGLTDAALSLGIEVNALVPLNEDGCANLSEIVVNAIDLGFNQVFCERLLDNGGDVVSVSLLEKALEAVRQLRAQSYSVGFDNDVPCCFSTFEERGSMAGLLSAYVDARGNLYPCRGSQCCLGSLIDGELEDMWRSPELEAWRQDIPALCKECKVGDLCPGGNRAARGEEGHDPLISGSVSRNGECLREVVLEEDLCPKPLYVTRSEDFGWLLMRADQVIPVSFKAGEILALFDGKHNLADVERRFGGAALSFVYSLYVRGFVELVEEERQKT